MPARLTIIGAGPGGYVAAIRAAQLGAQVTVVEEGEVGGTCLNWGCIPTKTLIASTEALEQMRNAEEFGIELTGEVRYNLNKIRERKDKVVQTQVKGIRALFKCRGITLIPGKGSLLSKDTVRSVQKDGTAQDIRSDSIIIATGSRPARISGFPFDGETVMTSDDAVQLKKVPKHLLIIGAGVIGCEFAFIYRSLGSAVTLVELMPRALSTEDEDMSSVIERELKKVKIGLITSTSVVSVARSAGGVMTARLSNEQEIQADAVLVSIGRSLNTENLRLEDAGLSAGKRGEVPVNDRMETAVPGIYAIGDVTGGPQFTHLANYHAGIVIRNALFRLRPRASAAAIPRVTYTDPELAQVGLTEAEARKKYRRIRILRWPYADNDRAQAERTTHGFIKVITRPNGQILGCTIVGAEAGELLQIWIMALAKDMRIGDLTGLVLAYPTLSELSKRVAYTFYQPSLTKRWLRRLIDLLRRFG
jgi:dihydrolipoamide dehydrogenase